MKGFSIIIVSWNALELLKNYLPSVAETNYADFEIVIANNASTDESANWVRSAYPDVKIATFDQNYGYCGGNNRAVPFAGKEILVFLNNDVRVHPDWLTHLNEAFAHENIAAVQPKLRSVKQPDYFEYAGAAGGYIDRFGYPFCRGRIFDKVERDIGQYDDETDIFWASGAALAIRKDVFIKSGGFDEDFEFHMEEIDLCWRLQNQGYCIRYCPQSVAYHLGGGSLPMGSPRKVFYNFRNSLFMLAKNLPAKNFKRTLFCRLLLDYAAAIKALLSGKGKEFNAILRAHAYYFRNWRKLQLKRKKLQALRVREGNAATVYNGSIVLEYFLKGKNKFSDLAGNHNGNKSFPPS